MHEETEQPHLLLSIKSVWFPPKLACWQVDEYGNGTRNEERFTLSKLLNNLPWNICTCCNLFIYETSVSTFVGQMVEGATRSHDWSGQWSPEILRLHGSENTNIISCTVRGSLPLYKHYMQVFCAVPIQCLLWDPSGRFARILSILTILLLQKGERGGYFQCTGSISTLPTCFAPRPS